MIEIKHVKKSYQNGNKTAVILNDVSISIDQGEFIILMGKSGAVPSQERL